MNLDISTLASLALQIPLALVIVFLVIKFLEHMRANHEATLVFIKEQATVNREFLAAQRAQMNESIGRLAEEIKNNKIETVKEVAILTTNIDASINRLMLLEMRIKEKEHRL